MIRAQAEQRRHGRRDVELSHHRQLHAPPDSGPGAQRPFETPGDEGIRAAASVIGTAIDERPARLEVGRFAEALSTMRIDDVHRKPG